MTEETTSTASDSSQRKGVNPHVIYAIVLAVVVIAFSLLLYKSDKPGTLKIQLGDNELEMKLEGDSLSVKTMLDLLFSDSEKSRETCALLKEFGKLYRANDPSIVDALETQDKRSKVSMDLRTLLYELRGPFDRSTHTFYNVEEPDIVDAIEKLGFDHPVSKRLRELLTYRKGPFEEKATEITISVPKGNKIPIGRAASCKSNKFYRREVRIFNKQRTSFISVYVSGSFPCPKDSDNSEINNLLQLSYVDIEKLIGDSPLTGKEIAFGELALDVQ